MSLTTGVIMHNFKQYNPRAHFFVYKYGFIRNERTDNDAEVERYGSFC